MTTYDDYQNLLFSYNFTGDAINTLAVPNINLARDQDGNLIIDYTVFRNITDVNSASYYAPYTAVTNEIATQSNYKQNAETAFVSIMQGNFGDYGVMFSDVAQLKFEESTSGTGAITFGQLNGQYFDDSSNTTSATTAFSVPYNSQDTNASDVYGDIWINTEHDSLPLIPLFGENIWDRDQQIVPGTEAFKILTEEVLHSLGVDIVENAPNSELNSLKYTMTAYTNTPHPDMDSSVLPTGLGIFDIAALQEIYGADTTTRVGDTVYKNSQGFGALVSDAFVYTIWDAGGNDTIDASVYQFGAQIDLREGHFSSIGDRGDGQRVSWDSGSYDAGNVGIAYGAIIENAIGTDFDDSFIGVEGRVNSFDGRGGIDTISYQHYTTAIDVDLNAGIDSEGNALSSIERVILGEAGGSVTGSSGDDELIGGNGNDVLDGFSGGDILLGGAGNDILRIDTSDANVNSYVDGGDGIDLLDLDFRGSVILNNGGAITQTGIAENIEGMIISGGDIYVETLGWIFDAQGNASAIADGQGSEHGLINYSAIDHALHFDFADPLDWTVSNLSFANLAHDSYINVGGVGASLYGPRVVGSDNGDLFTFNTSFHPNVQPEIELGSGDDIVDLSTYAYPEFTYTGGHDVINYDFANGHRAAERSRIWLGPEIEHADVTFIENNVTAISLSSSLQRYAFDLVIDVGSHGSITIDNLEYEVRKGADGVFGTSDDVYRRYMPEVRTADGGQFNDRTENYDYSSGGNSTILGTSQSEIIHLSNAGYTVNAEGGDDLVHGTDGNETVYGDGGDDIIHGNDGADRLEGGLGHDILNGGLGADRLYGGQSDDVINGNEDNDYLYGQNGNDTLKGGEGNDWLEGGYGFDKAIFSGLFADYFISSSNVSVTVQDNVGSDGTNTLYDIEKIQFLDGFLENGIFTSTSINGSNISEILDGDDEDNLMNGYEGDDSLFGGLGSDHLYGGSGNDDLRGQGDANEIDYLYGEDGNDLLLGGSADELYGGTGDDSLRGYGGTGHFDGGDDVDEIWWRDSDVAINADLNAGTATDENGNIATIVNVENLVGTSFSDTLIGDDNANILDGGADRNGVLDLGDVLRGNGGNDKLYGRSGDDILYGDDGNDALYGNDGADTLYGGIGKDTLRGGSEDDELYGNEDNDILRGESGNDEIHGGDGKDKLYGDIGNDTLYGDAGKDRLYANEGDDLLYGGDSNDQLWGQDGSDIMTGGAGADIFYFLENETGIDTIMDFSSNEDKLDISDILDGYYTEGVDSIADFLSISDNGVHTTITIDQDGANTVSSAQDIAVVENVIWASLASFMNDVKI